MAFKEQIKGERQKLDMTQKETAELLEVSKSAVEKWEYGKEPLKITQEGALARLRKVARNIRGKK